MLTTRQRHGNIPSQDGWYVPGIDENACLLLQTRQGNSSAITSFHWGDLLLFKERYCLNYPISFPQPSFCQEALKTRGQILQIFWGITELGWKPQGDIALRVASCKQVLGFPGLEHIHLTGKAGGSSDLFSALGCKHKWNPARAVMVHTACVQCGQGPPWHLQRDN